MREFNPSDYGAIFAPLLTVDRCRPLDAGTPVADARGELAGIDLDNAFAGAIADRELAQLCVAGLWLLYDDLDASHNISQQVETPTGSFWHGIMHRREGDFDNAKYWFRRVGRHKVYEPLAQRAAELIAAADPREAAAARQCITDGPWDAMKFVDLVQDVLRGKQPCETLCRQIAQAEWELLFDDCYRRATGE